MTLAPGALPGWSPAQGPPELEFERVHVWACVLDCEAPLAAGDLPLDPAERTRVERYRRPVDAARFALARTFLRRTLGAYLSLAPSSVPLVVGSNGKPGLATGGPADPPRFNLAHSGDLALLAVAWRHAVGIDVEARHALPDLDGLVRRCLSERERDSLSGRSRDERESDFFRLWTRKEALLKGLGLGLSLDLALTDVLDPAQPVLGHEDDRLTDQARSGWVIHDLDPAVGYFGALAVQGPAGYDRLLAGGP